MTIRFSEFSNKIQNSTHRALARIAEGKIAPSPIREEFFSTDKFSVGKTVLSEGKLWEILDKRCNYVVLIGESGGIKKKFPGSITESTKTISYPENTFKGVSIPTGMREFVESVSEKDPYAIIKALGAYSAKDYAVVQSVGESLGAKMTEITESTKQEQYQAALIVASAIGCKSQAKDAIGVLADIKHTASKGNMNPNQKKIYTDMLGMLKKLGMNTEDPIVKEAEEPIVRKSFSDLKKKLETGGTKIPGEEHTRPGSSLGASNETHRRQLVRKLQGND